MLRRIILSTLIGLLGLIFCVAGAFFAFRHATQGDILRKRQSLQHKTADAVAETIAAALQKPPPFYSNSDQEVSQWTVAIDDPAKTEEGLERYLRAHPDDPARRKLERLRLFATRYLGTEQMNVLIAQLLEDKDQAVVEMARQTMSQAQAEDLANRCREANRLKLKSVPMDLSFTAIDGRKIDLAAMRGKVVLIDLWGTECPPCVAELPNIRQVYDKYHPAGLEVIGLALGDTPASLDRFLRQHPLPWPLTPVNWGGELDQLYGASPIPQLWLLDRTGTVATFDARENLEGKVAALLAGEIAQ